MSTTEDIALVKILRDEGLSMRDISKETGIPTTTVHRILTQRADAEGIDLLRARVEEQDARIKVLEEQVEKLLPKSKKIDKPKIPKINTFAWISWAETVSPEEAEAERKFQEEQAQYN